MKIKDLLDELSLRECYSDFKSKYPNSYFSTGFFIMGDNKDNVQLNFFIPDENKIASFEYPFASYKVHADEIKNEVQFDNLNIKVDLDNLKDTIESKLNKKIEKIIALISDGVWNITCINGYDITRIKMNAKNGNIIENTSDFLGDFMKKI